MAEHRKTWKVFCQEIVKTQYYVHLHKNSLKSFGHLSNLSDSLKLLS